MGIMRQGKEREKEEMKKTIKLSACKFSRTMPQDCYIFYGDAKRAGLRQGDLFQMINDNDGDILDGDYEVVRYVIFRDDIQKTFEGFECQRIDQ
jgi:hypothetical protein